MTQAVICPGCNQQIAIDDSPQQNELNQVRVELEESKIPKNAVLYSKLSM